MPDDDLPPVKSEEEWRAEHRGHDTVRAELVDEKLHADVLLCATCPSLLVLDVGRHH